MRECNFDECPIRKQICEESQMNIEKGLENPNIGCCPQCPSCCGYCSNRRKYEKYKRKKVNK